MQARYEIFGVSEGEHRFRLTAANGESILVSRRHRSPSSCASGICSVQESCRDDSRYRRLRSRSGEYYFALTNGNGQTLGTSRMYDCEAARERGIASVKTSGATARVRDAT